MEWCVIAHNIRSALNIGGIFRTADGSGAKKIYLTGYSPVPAKVGAIYQTSAQKMITKTALGAQSTMPWEYKKSISVLIEQLKKKDWQIVALEQDLKSVSFEVFRPEKKLLLLWGMNQRVSMFDSSDNVIRSLRSQCMDLKILLM